MVPHAHPAGVSAGTYLAGFQATPVGGVASASATFTIPKVTCTSKDKSDGAQFDLGVYTDDFEVWSYINVSCGLRGASYADFLGTPSGQNAQTTKAGDTVVSSLSESATATLAEIHDLTSGQNLVDEDANPVASSVIDIGSGNYVAAGQRRCPHLFEGHVLQRHRQRRLSGHREPDGVQRTGRRCDDDQDRGSGDERQRIELLAHLQARLVGAAVV